MHVCIHSRARDAEALIDRCRQLGVHQVCLALASVPGYEATGVPDGDYLTTFVRRLADAGIQVPTAIAWFGNDPDLVLNPGAHQRVYDAKARTLEAVGQAGIFSVLHYIDLAQSQDPA